MKIVLVGFYVHLLVLKGAFDIYFQSPLIHGMAQFKSTKNPPAKRVVLIISDGLRAEAIYGKDEETLTPYLTHIRENVGSWGISHTRVPTESRPGHVAILAGVYEDPSAVTKGWQENPVEFDSVVNQSRNTFAWGSPDILHIFKKGDFPHVSLSTYDPDMEDFAQNSTYLDGWVLSKLMERIGSEKANGCREFCDTGNFFFLHLLGMDTVGHAAKPGSDAYITNIKYVDVMVRKVEELFENFFNDSSTSYVFTSDHGMTNWGSHGSGSKHETDVPFITWGAGIAKQGKTKDIEQADIAPLLAALIGINLPVNSVGRLPYQYLSIDRKEVANIMLANVKQIGAMFKQYESKMEKNLFQLFYKPFEPLAGEKFNKLLDEIVKMIKEGRNEDAIDECKTIIGRVLDGYDYFQNYFQKTLLSNITFGFFNWIVFLIISVTNSPAEDVNLSFSDVGWLPRLDSRVYKYCFIPLIIVSMILTYAQSLPVSFHFYLTFPYFMCWLVMLQWPQVTYTIHLLHQFEWWRVFSYGTVYVAATALLIHTFYARQALTVLTNLIGLWVFVQPKLNISDKLKFFLACVCISVFPVLPVMKTKFDLTLYLIGVVFWSIALGYTSSKTVFHPTWKGINSAQVPMCVGIQLVVCFIAVSNVLFVRVFFQQNVVSQIISWVILPFAFLSSMFSGRLMFNRLISITTGILSYYLLVTCNYEGIFLMCYTTLLYQWLRIEDIIQNGKVTFPFGMFKNSLDMQQQLNSVTDIRQAFFFLTFIVIGFFGTGNVASISSFDPMWVQCFTTVFSPFTMSFLILLKLFVPFLLASCSFRCLHTFTNGKIINMFAIVLVFTDLMLAYFLYNIKNVGSWLDIGVSISNFIISNVIAIVLLLLYGIAHLMTTASFSFDKILF